MNMSATTLPKSDQLNADDLIGRTITIKVRDVQLSLDSDQPCSVYFDGDNNKPYKPGKSMRRVLVAVWGEDAKVYIGRSMTLFRDEKVQFGGLVVGGIRISHMSHITQSKTMGLTATKGHKKAYTVQPLKQETAPAEDKAAALANSLIARVNAVESADDLQAVTSLPKTIEQRDWLKANRSDLSAKVEQAVAAKTQSFAPPPDDDTFPGDIPLNQSEMPE